MKSVDDLTPQEFAEFLLQHLVRLEHIAILTHSIMAAKSYTNFEDFQEAKKRTAELNGLIKEIS